MFLQRILDQGCLRKETFDISKLLVRRNNSRNIIAEITFFWKISILPLRMKMRKEPK